MIDDYCCYSTVSTVKPRVPLNVEARKSEKLEHSLHNLHIILIDELQLQFVYVYHFLAVFSSLAVTHDRICSPRINKDSISIDEKNLRQIYLILKYQ